MDMKFGLSNEIISKINTVFACHPEIEEAIIFGSRAKGTYREGSDIDISLKGELLTESIKMDVLMEIDALNSPYLFDISIFNLLGSVDLKEHINRVGQIFYKK
jgi:uncharacterized protein